jgi:hypothetical protein
MDTRISEELSSSIFKVEESPVLMMEAAVSPKP